jgi:glycosyltransferase involved in cell wall biosynthesis
VVSQSVFRQGTCELEYFVCDGASTDGTQEIVLRFEAQGVRLISEADAGFYAALAKGLQRVTGDYVAYLNAGDMYHPGGVGIAAECLELPGVQWLTGYATIYNDRSQLTRSWLPFRYRRHLFECGAYGTLLPFLQQESTVWRRELLAAVDFSFLERLRFAGDAYVWKCFASMSPLFVVQGHIGGFRVHKGQLSERLADYRKELRSFSRTATILERAQCAVERVLWHMPERVKWLADRSNLIAYNHARRAWTRGNDGA